MFFLVFSGRKRKREKRRVIGKKAVIKQELPTTV